MNCFDLIVVEKFKELEENSNNTRTKIKGHCNCYNNVDDVWKFTVKDADVKDEASHKPLNETSQYM